MFRVDRISDLERESRSLIDRGTPSQISPPAPNIDKADRCTAASGLSSLSVLFVGIENFLNFLVETVICTIATERRDTRTVVAERGHGAAEVVHMPEFSLVEKVEFNKTVQNSDGVLRVRSSVWQVNTPSQDRAAILSCPIAMDVVEKHLPSLNGREQLRRKLRRFDPSAHER